MGGRPSGVSQKSTGCVLRLARTGRCQEGLCGGAGRGCQDCGGRGAVAAEEPKRPNNHSAGVLQANSGPQNLLPSIRNLLLLRRAQPFAIATPSTAS